MAFPPEIIELLRERVQGLPEEVTQLLKDNSIRIFAEAMQKEFELTNEQSATLENEIVLTVLVLSPFEKLYGNLISAIPQEKAAKITQKVYQEILIDIVPLIVDLENKEKRSDQDDSEIDKGALPKGKREEYERLHLRPEEQERQAASGQTKPLTREDILNSLSRKRTMQGDIENIKAEKPDDGNQKE